MDAAGKSAALTGKTGPDAAACTRIHGSLAEVARVASSAPFGVASIIGVVEVAARQWAVAKAKNGQDLPGSKDCRPAPEEQSGAERDDDYSREGVLEEASL